VKELKKADAPLLSSLEPDGQSARQPVLALPQPQPQQKALPTTEPPQPSAGATGVAAAIAGIENRANSTRASEPAAPRRETSAAASVPTPKAAMPVPTPAAVPAQPAPSFSAAASAIEARARLAASLADSDDEDDSNGIVSAKQLAQSFVSEKKNVAPPPTTAGVAAASSRPVDAKLRSRQPAENPFSSSTAPPASSVASGDPFEQAAAARRGLRPTGKAASLSIPSVAASSALPEPSPPAAAPPPAPLPAAAAASSASAVESAALTLDTSDDADPGSLSMSALLGSSGIGSLSLKFAPRKSSAAAKGSRLAAGGHGQPAADEEFDLGEEKSFGVESFWSGARSGARSGVGAGGAAKAAAVPKKSTAPAWSSAANISSEEIDVDQL
jgi:hypothetical protein